MEKKKLLIIFDVETTGLIKHPDAPIKKQPRIIEFGAAALSLSTGKVQRTLSVLINPEEKITEEIEKITGIKDEDLKDKPTFADAWSKSIFPFIKKGTAMLAHNEPFDHQLVDYELARCKATFKWPPTFCTIGLYKEQWGRDMKLVELYSHIMGRELDQKHRAGSDVDALVEIVRKEKLWQVLV
jgi:DNA polymerase III epsilon subunit-like protein